MELAPAQYLYHANPDKPLTCFLVPVVSFTPFKLPLFFDGMCIRRIFMGPLISLWGEGPPLFDCFSLVVLTKSTCHRSMSVGIRGKSLANQQALTALFEVCFYPSEREAVFQVPTQSSAIVFIVQFATKMERMLPSFVVCVPLSSSNLSVAGGVWR